MRDAPARGIAWGAALVLLADVPLAFTRGDVLRKPALLAFAGLVVAAGAAASARPRRLALATLLPLAVPGFALLALPRGGDLAPAAWVREACVWIGVALLSFGLLQAWEGTGGARRAWRAVVLAGAAAAAWTALDALLRGTGGAGPFGRPGIAGPVLGALAAAAVVLPGAGRGPLVAVLAAGCALTRSRTGMAAGAAAGLLALALAPPAWLPRPRVLLPAAALALALASGLALAGVLPVPGGRDSARVRAGLHRASRDLLAERPALGHGLGSFPAEVLRRRDPEEALLSAGRRPDQAHADLLHVAVEGGAAAGLALLAWGAGVAVVGLAARRRAASPEDRRTVEAALVAWVALALASLGEDVLLDPAPGLLVALAAGTAALGLRRAREPAGRASASARLAMAAGGLACAWVLARAAVADRHLMAYREAIRGGVTAEEAARAAEERLVRGALAWRPDQPEALYRLGVDRAKRGRFEDARRTWRLALRSDPGRTEARLDIARTFELEGRTEDAREALREARRRDPTRYEVPLRLGHLALGPEPVPGDPPDPAFDPIPPLRAYNEAAALAPARFENFVARARLERRRGDLEAAAALLQEAGRRAPAAAETTLETFRWIEARAWREGGGKGLVRALATLAEALVADPDLAAEVRAEAERLLDEAERREEAVRAAAAADPARADFSRAERVFGAAALRWAALVRVGLPGGAEVLARARADAEARRWRRSLARYRALLPWIEEGADPSDAPSVGRVADLYLEAAKVASRTDGDLARLLYYRGHLAVAAEHLAEGRAAEAEATLGRVLEGGRDTAEVRWLLARARARRGDLDGAEDHLVRALAADASLAAALATTPELAPLRDRPRVREAVPR